VLGVKIAPHKTILVPTAHDEPAIRLEIYKELFSVPAGLAYNTDVERRFLTTHFSIRAVEEETVGCGVELPQAHHQPRERHGPADDGPGQERVREGQTEESSPSYRPHLADRGGIFRRRHRLHGPIALYGGRIDPGKGCEELIEYFSAYAQEGGDASLVLMGVKLMPLPEEPFIRFAGRLSDQERCRRWRPPRWSSCRHPTRACRCSRSSPSRSARRFWPTRAARCSSSTAAGARRDSTTPTGTSSPNVSSCSWRTTGCAAPWDATAGSTSASTTGGT
jgi:glycosyltransferase involved in cell wall biosynthesis